MSFGNVRFDVTVDNSVTSGRSFGVAALLAVVAGAMVFGYGLLLGPVSVLGGAHVAAIGLSLVLSGVFATEWAGDRFGLSAADRRRLSLAFGVLAAVLLVAFVVLNWATFEVEELESGS